MEHVQIRHNSEYEEMQQLYRQSQNHQSDHLRGQGEGLAEIRAALEETATSQFQFLESRIHDFDQEMRYMQNTIQQVWNNAMASRRTHSQNDRDDGPRDDGSSENGLSSVISESYWPSGAGLGFENARGDSVQRTGGDSQEPLRMPSQVPFTGAHGTIGSARGDSEHNAENNNQETAI